MAADRKLSVISVQVSYSFCSRSANSSAFSFSILDVSPGPRKLYLAGLESGALAAAGSLLGNERGAREGLCTPQNRGEVLEAPVGGKGRGELSCNPAVLEHTKASPRCAHTGEKSVLGGADGISLTWGFCALPQPRQRPLHHHLQPAPEPPARYAREPEPL